MSTTTAFKFVRKDGTTRNGYRWPIVTTGEPVRVEASNPTVHDDPCPQHDGDGLCLARTIQGAQSGGIRMVDAVGLHVTFDEADVLASDGDKIRVAAVTVIGCFDPVKVLNTGPWPTLSGADLYGANLSGANLYGADLSEAYLYGANLTGANGRDDWDDLIARGAIR